MDTKKIYKTRFSNEIKQRFYLWRVLIDNFFQKYFDKNDVVLDLGCGYGEFITQINCRKKYAVDLNPDSKKYLSREVVFYKQSSTKMDKIKSGIIDKIFVSNFFEHLTRNDIALTIKEVHRILKKNGQILILQPNIRLLTADFWRFFDHITPIDDRALEELFRSEGFILKKRLFRFLPFTTKSGLPKSLAIVKLYLKLPLFWNIFGRQSFLIFEKL